MRKGQAVPLPPLHRCKATHLSCRDIETSLELTPLHHEQAQRAMASPCIIEIERTCDMQQVSPPSPRRLSWFQATAFDADLDTVLRTDLSHRLTPKACSLSESRTSCPHDLLQAFRPAVPLLLTKMRFGEVAEGLRRRWGLGGKTRQRHPSGVLPLPISHTMAFFVSTKWSRSLAGPWQEGSALSLFLSVVPWLNQRPYRGGDHLSSLAYRTCT